MATEDGETALNGKISVNTSGGLKARGQPGGAVGIAQAVEVVRQLRGEAGKRQVHNAGGGVTHTLGGRGGPPGGPPFRGGEWEGGARGLAGGRGPGQPVRAAV